MKIICPLLFLLSLSFTFVCLRYIYKEKKTSIPPHIIDKDIMVNPIILNKDSVFSNGNYLSIVKEKGVIPDAITALRVAVEITHKLYGDKVLEQTPYRIVRNGDLWVVSSSVPEKYNNINWIYDTSCFIFEINRYNGEIYDLKLR